MEQTNQTPVVAKPADERKAWIKPEMSKLDVEGGIIPDPKENATYLS